MCRLMDGNRKYYLELTNPNQEKQIKHVLICHSYFHVFRCISPVVTTEIRKIEVYDRRKRCQKSE